MSRSDALATVDLTDAEWQGVHRAIDQILDELQSRVQQERPKLTCRRETVHTARFHFNYRAFDPPRAALPVDGKLVSGGEDREPLVVGVRMEPADDRIRITGDICTEDSGRILYDEGCHRETAKSLEALTPAAREIARRLAAQWRLIAEYFD